VINGIFSCGIGEAELAEWVRNEIPDIS